MLVRQSSGALHGALDALGSAGNLVTAAGFALLRAVGLGYVLRAGGARRSGAAMHAALDSAQAQSAGDAASALRPRRPEAAAPTGGSGSGAGVAGGVELRVVEARATGSHGEVEGLPGLEEGVKEGGRRGPVRMAVPLSEVQDATIGELQRRLGEALGCLAKELCEICKKPLCLGPPDGFSRGSPSCRTHVYTILTFDPADLYILERHLRIMCQS